MKNTILIILLILASLTVSGPTLAAEKLFEPMPEERTFKDENAALRYFMAIGFMPELSRSEIDHLKDVKSIEDYKKVPKKIRYKLGEATSRRTLALLEFAADCKDSNFMPDQSYKPEDYVPPFRTLRRFAYYLNAGAWKAISDGKQKDGAKVLVGIFRFGDDAENYGPMISYMIGLAIRNIALDSMKSFLNGDFDPAAKKIIAEYLKALPRPAFRVKEGFLWERKFGENILKTLDSKEGAIEILKMANVVPRPESPKPANKPFSQCCANQRVLMGALEMAAMDGLTFSQDQDFASILQKLVDDRYLNKPVACPRKGKYQVKIDAENDFIEVSCSCGADLEKPLPPEEKKSADNDKSSDPYEMEVAKKAEEYRNSGRFDQDRKELMEFYDKLMQFDQFQEGALKKIKELQKEYESKGNIIVNAIAINAEKVFEKQLSLQKQIDELIK